jgi:hypothetical protein
LPALAIPLLYLVGFVVSYGALVAYRGQGDAANESIKGLLLWLAERIDAVRIGVWRASGRPLAFAADALRWVAHSIEDALTAVAGFFASPVAQFWHALADPPIQVAHALARFAAATASSIARIERETIPDAIRRALEGPRSKIAAALAALTYLRAHAIPALEHGLDWTRGRVGRLEREATRTGARLRAAEKYLTAAGATVLTVWGLNRLRLRWLRCSKVGRVGRAVCGFDADLLESLLLGSALVVGSVSLIELVREAEGMMDEGIGALRAVVREF